MTIRPLDYHESLKRLISEGYDIAGVDPTEGTIDVVTDPSEDSLIEADKSLTILQRRDINPEIAPDAKYTTYDHLTTILKDAQTKYPNLVHVESAGKSLEGRDLWVVKITANVKAPVSGRPVVFFNAMHHAREVMTTEIALDVIDYLTKNYGSNDKVTQWVNQTEIWVVPMVNPDGNNKVWTSDSMWRKNARDGYGVDINRNYPYKWDACGGSSGSHYAQDYRGPSAGSEPETKAMMALVGRIKPVLSISYHSYSELVIYPFGCDGEHTPNRQVIEAIGKDLAGRLPKDSKGGTYAAGTSWELLYAVDGGDIDWYYAEQDVTPFVIEVNSSSQGFQPDYKWRQPTVEKMRAGWGYLLDRAHQSGVRGHVTDNSGRPVVQGTVVVESMGSHSLSDAAVKTYRIKPDGSFHVLLDSGMYKIKVTSGSQSWTQQMTVGGTRQDINISLPN